MRRAAAVALLAAAAGLAAGCSASGSPGTPAATTSAAASAAPSTPSGRVAAVPGTDSNTYVAGPFTVSLLPGSPRIPGHGCPSAGNGPNATTGIAVRVKNTSRSFYGYADPSVVFVKGHSLRGQVVATTQGGTPQYGCVGGTDPLHPGQSQTVWIVPPLPRTYYTWQLTSVTYYNSATSQANLGTTVQFRW